MNPQIKDLLIVLFIIFGMLSISNLIGSIIGYYIIKHDIEEIEDVDLRIDLLQSLTPAKEVFLKRIVYHTEEFFFTDEESHFRYILYRHMHPHEDKSKVVITKEL